MCSVLVNKLHPSRDVIAAIPNAAANQRVEDLVAARHAVATRNGKTFETIYFTSPSLPGLEMSAAQRFVVVMVPGPANAIWVHFGPAIHVSIVPNLPPIVNAGTTIGSDIFFAQNRAENMACVRNEGFAVDNDKNPDPENVPGLFTPPVDNARLFEGQSWEWDGIDRCQMAGGEDMTMHLSVTVLLPSGSPTSSFSCTSSRWRGSLKSYCRRQVQVWSMQQVPHL